MNTVISTKTAPAAIGPYSQAVETGNVLYISGQVPVNPVSGKIESQDITTQTELVFANIKAILTAAGYSMNDVVKTTVFLTDMALFPALNEVYKTHFLSNYPARSTVAVAALPLGALVEIETIAARQ